ncbi:MAG: hypothetical protein ACRD4Y_16110, partial [Candidatus Acidiferrales bacterium]
CNARKDFNTADLGSAESMGLGCYMTPDSNSMPANPRGRPPTDSNFRLAGRATSATIARL